MKKVFIVALMTAAVSTAYAGQQQQQDTNVVSSAVAGSSNEGNNQTIIFQNPEQRELTRQVIETTGNQGVNYSGEYKLKNVPSMASPNLTTSNDTCMGSISGSVAVPGFGIGGGSTVIDENCVMLKNSRELWNMGMRAAAMARMCMDTKNREALEITGFKCPQEEAAKEEQQAPIADYSSTFYNH